MAAVAGAWPVGPASPVGNKVAVVLLALWVASRDRVRSLGGRAVSLVCVGALVAAAIAQRLTEPGVGLAWLIGGTLMLAWLWRPTNETRPTVAAVALALVAVLIPDQLGVPRAPVVALLAGLGASAVSLERHVPSDLVETLLGSPARLLVTSFAAIAAAGSLLLVLPAASVAPGSIRLIDAAFTAVSAVCVTGLIVLDTPNDFTRLGQGMILALIQVGGLGIMTFATSASVFLGRRLRVREESMAAEMLGGGEAVRQDLEAALRTVLKVTLVSEAVGAALLTGLFLGHGDTLPQAAWRGLFTSISAFCNAGFALQSDSLIPYQGDPGVLLVVSTLIVVGGLGPLVVAALPKLRRTRPSLHVHLVLVVTAWLLVVPMGVLLALEWDNTLAGMPVTDKLSNAWFQSVTLRTAGFNSIDIAAVRPASWTLMIVCMFIGGSSGSTAGGVKTTTLAVLLLAVLAAIRSQTQPEAYGRRIPHQTVYEAGAIATVSILSCLGWLAALQLTQAIELQSALFEVVSALGTVGLSVGATAQLDDVGKVLIIGAMFAGRVGPLTLFMFLMGRPVQAARRYPLEALQVG